MSANQSPFPGHSDHNGNKVSPETASEQHFAPPRLRLGLGPLNSPSGLPLSNIASPSSTAWNAKQTPAYSHAQLSGQMPFAAQENTSAQGSSPSSQGNFFGGRGIASHPSMSPSPLSNADDRTQPIAPMKPSQFNRFTTRTLGNEPVQSSPAQFNPLITRTLGSESMAEPYTTGMLPTNSSTGALGAQMGEYSGNTGMLKLNQPVKVVKIPIPGRPGEFKTGILPVIPQASSGTLPPPSFGTPASKGISRQGKILLITTMVFIVLMGTISVFLLHPGSKTTTTANTSTGTSSVNQASATSTALVGATATAVSNASILVDDALSSNAHNWLIGVHNGINYSFTNGAYHIRQNGTNFGYAIMYSEELPKNYTYSLTMQNVAYDTGNSNALSFYGLIMNYRSYSSTKASFYLFRVNNGSNITYEFDKFDNRTTGDNQSPWQEIFPDKNNSAGMGKGNGKEFRGPHQANVYSVTNINGQFTFLVNGKQIGAVKDTSFTGGGLGMGVSQAGSEAAFTNLILRGN